MTEDQIKHMVDRFLSWKLPETFNPDGGISFKRTFNENTPHPMKHEPSGTNLFDAGQADAMVRHMLEGLPAAGVAAADEINSLRSLMTKLATARKKHLDAVEAYNARVRLVRSERERGNHSMNVDVENRAMFDAQSEWIKAAQDAAEVALVSF